MLIRPILFSTPNHQLASFPDGAFRKAPKYRSGRNRRERENPQLAFKR
jgi:hypothetical protein